MPFNQINILRTLAINSNQIVLSFSVLIVFLSPKQSEIEESSLESLRKSRIQGVWDPAHSTQEEIPSGCRHIPPGCCRHSTQLRRHFPSSCRHFPPGCITSGNLMRRHFIQMSYIRNSGAGWERRAFQLLRLDISESSYTAYPESFATILHNVAVFS